MQKTTVNEAYQNNDHPGFDDLRKAECIRMDHAKWGLITVHNQITWSSEITVDPATHHESRSGYHGGRSVDGPKVAYVTWWLSEKLLDEYDIDFIGNSDPKVIDLENDEWKFIDYR